MKTYVLFDGTELLLESLFVREHVPELVKHVLQSLHHARLQLIQIVLGGLLVQLILQLVLIFGIMLQVLVQIVSQLLDSIL